MCLVVLQIFILDICPPYCNFVGQLPPLSIKAFKGFTDFPLEFFTLDLNGQRSVRNPLMTERLLRFKEQKTTITGFTAASVYSK